MLNKITLPPSAAGLSASIRGMGYSLSMAVSDIVDNSISAGASHIEIETPDGESYSRLSILDNGRGMGRDELISAMKLGTFSPYEERKITDLGRFGMGLKSASFSQCRRLIVISKQNKTINGFYWDLDYLSKTNEWQLTEVEDFSLFDEVDFLSEFESGTVIIWDKLDRSFNSETSICDEEENRDRVQIVRNLRKHLALTFHRFLEDGDFELTLNGLKVEAWDPFFRFHPSKFTDYPPDYWPTNVITPKVQLRIYILPLPEYMEKDTLYYFSNDDDLNLQGFFIYRGKRLISAGGWLGLRDLNRDPKFKLARIQVDFDNKDDMEWRLDIRKSIAKPPKALRAWLRNHALKARRQSEKSLIRSPSFKHKEFKSSFWKTKRGCVALVDWTNSLVNLFLEGATEQKLSQEEVRGFLELLALSHPTSIAKAKTQSPSEDALKAIQYILNVLTDEMTPEDAILYLSRYQPFDSWPAILTELTSNKGM